MSNSNLEVFAEDDDAACDEGGLSPVECKRRRDSSISDDHNVQLTNDDATQCKRFAVSLGYWSDAFIESFGQGQKPERRDPEINRGYWARVVAIRKLVDEFLAKAGEEAQIVNFGSGYDTLYWLLCESSAKFSCFVDVDFCSITAKKIHQILKPGSLLTPFVASERKIVVGIGWNGKILTGKEITVNGHTDLHSPRYHLIGADLRQLAELKDKLEWTNLDKTRPTLFLSECVLVYMAVDQSAQLIKFASDLFPHSCFLNYEQVNLDDVFGRVMKENLHSRGIALSGMDVCSSIADQRQRFLDNGYDKASTSTLYDVYEQFVPIDTRKTMEAIEFFDEKELLNQLLQHYCIVFATKKGESFTDIGFPYSPDA